MTKLSFNYPLGSIGKAIAITISLLTSIVIFFCLLLMVHLQIAFMKILFVCFIMIVNLIYDFLLIRSKEVWYDEKGISFNSKKSIHFIKKDRIYKFQRRFFFFYQIYFQDPTLKEGNLIFFIGPNAPIRRLPAITEIMKR